MKVRWAAGQPFEVPDVPAHVTPHCFMDVSSDSGNLKTRMPLPNIRMVGTLDGQVWLFILSPDKHCVTEVRLGDYALEKAHHMAGVVPPSGLDLEP